MTDHLEWPFFEPHHRSLSSSLTAWAASNRDVLESEADVERATRDIAASLGAAGWLRYLVPAAWGGALPDIDVRSLCVIRETLAAHSGVADCAFAIQGLGSVPVTLFGTDALKQQYLPGVIAGTGLGA